MWRWLLYPVIGLSLGILATEAGAVSELRYDSAGTHTLEIRVLGVLVDSETRSIDEPFHIEFQVSRWMQAFVAGGLGLGLASACGISVARRRGWRNPVPRWLVGLILGLIAGYFARYLVVVRAVEGPTDAEVSVRPLGLFTLYEGAGPPGFTATIRGQVHLSLLGAGALLGLLLGAVGCCRCRNAEAKQSE